MVATYVSNLEAVLSTDRLAPYRPPGGDDLAMVTTYFWNIALCQALYHSLGSLEIAMRNGIHLALTTRYGQPNWYDVSNLLLPREAAAIARAVRDIRETKRSESRRGINPVIPGRVVAALRFGFWTSILDAAYGNSPKGPQFWTSTNGLLAVAFPHSGGFYHQHRGRVHRRFNDIRILRNRVSHYEPIWQGVSLPDGRFVSLADLYTQIIETIGWVSPTLQKTTTHLDQFPRARQKGYASIERRMKRRLGIS